MHAFNQSNSYGSGKYPLAMRYLRNVPVSDLPPAAYDPATQMSVHGGDPAKMMGGAAAPAACPRPRGERMRDFGKSDDDRQKDD